MKNKNGTTEDLVECHENGVLKYSFITYEGSSSEYTYDYLGYVLTYKDSEGYSSEYTRDEEGYILTYKHIDKEKNSKIIPFVNKC